ncbi:barstar family protein [Allostreptomyces psammosilenae]|uniref:RNAse (Barnase) inhibitor barstar n=1 Tax=Allostreptomyces psammosilenae TaxID=1892865 RepID=A0A852ZYK9_9ACTN|nr:barstar family protein [Allostreptomyces psammosilenae]NYI07239.1 RNAse (barnase) inhibitor barstar [Allostreptomyces psammosilenae]
MSFVARLDGRRMLDSQGVFEEFSRAFEFPVYFGWNWNALNDCLGDLGWMPSRRYLVVVGDAGLVLSREPERRSTLLEILNHQGGCWGSRFPGMTAWGTGDVAFNVLFLCPAGELRALEEELAGVPLDR